MAVTAEFFLLRKEHFVKRKLVFLLVQLLNRDFCFLVIEQPMQ